MLNKHNLSIAKFCSTEESRFVVGSILVTDVETVATDGHTLIRVSSPEIPAESFPNFSGFKAEEKFKPFLLPRDAALKVAKQLESKGSIPALQCVGVDAATDADGDAVLGTNNLEIADIVRIKKPVGEFPKWKNVIPDTERAVGTIIVNADKLKELMAAAAASCKGDPIPMVTLRFFSNKEALRVDCSNEDGQYFTGVLMPLNPDSAETKVV